MIEEELRGRGLTTCVDKSSQPSPYSNERKAKMQDDISKSDSILIFVTSKFMSKVNGMDGNNDMCKLEYDYALKSASSKLVIVILEERMRNISQWKGALRCLSCNRLLYVIYVMTDLSLVLFGTNQTMTARTYILFSICPDSHANALSDFSPFTTRYLGGALGRTPR